MVACKSESKTEKKAEMLPETLLGVDEDDLDLEDDDDLLFPLSTKSSQLINHSHAGRDRLSLMASEETH